MSLSIGGSDFCPPVLSKTRSPVADKIQPNKKSYSTTCEKISGIFIFVCICMYVCFFMFLSVKLVLSRIKWRQMKEEESSMMRRHRLKCGSVKEKMMEGGTGEMVETAREG